VSLQELCEYSWPGNVRQLENTIERAVALATGDEVVVELPTEKPKVRAVAAGAESGFAAIPMDGSFSIPAEGLDMEGYVAGLERAILKSALDKSNDVQTRAAGMLNLSYRSFRHLLKKYDL
ncbi:MAG TPA: helix-turn-helix domain-containing protein, partial [Terriglobales bacterium]|nr:helix-turn-helix domain-containing protein [Terriglobales bacterium]